MVSEKFESIKVITGAPNTGKTIELCEDIKYILEEKDNKVYFVFPGTEEDILFLYEDNPQNLKLAASVLDTNVIDEITKEAEKNTDENVMFWLYIDSVPVSGDIESVLKSLTKAREAGVHISIAVQEPSAFCGENKEWLVNNCDIFSTRSFRRGIPLE